MNSNENSPFLHEKAICMFVFVLPKAHPYGVNKDRRGQTKAPLRC